MAEHGMTKAGKNQREVTIKLGRNENLGEKRVNPAHLEVSDLRVCTAIYNYSIWSSSSAHEELWWCQCFLLVLYCLCLEVHTHGVDSLPV